MLFVRQANMYRLSSSSQARIEKKLTKFLAEVQVGLREGSVVATEDAANTISRADM
jgi:hypothetical protein